MQARSHLLLTGLAITSLVALGGCAGGVPAGGAGGGGQGNITVDFTMREALRVLEVMGFVEIRKGTSGGAFVAEVDMKTTINSIINFIHFKPISVK